MMLMPSCAAFTGMNLACMLLLLLDASGVVPVCIVANMHELQRSRTYAATQLHSCRQDSTFEGKTTFSTSVLVGKRDKPLLTIAARQLVELAHSKGISK